MKGELRLVNKLESFEKEIDVDISRYDFGFAIYVDKKNPLELQLVKKDEFSSSIEDFVYYLESSSLEENEEEINIYRNLLNNIDDLWSYVEYVKLDLCDVDIIDFIDNNPFVRSKKIVIPDFLSIKDFDKIKVLLAKYDKYKDNIYVNMSNNAEYVNLVDCLNTISKIKKQADRILTLNLSPMETIMYTYDQVRNRVYKREESTDSPLKSRDLSSVLSNDEIVCVGYSNIFQALLYYMNINCLNVDLSSKISEDMSGHERNVIYVKDEKYNIDGVYYFDATWDSKKENEINEFLNRYTFFAKTRKQMIEIEHDCYIYDACPYYSDDMVSDVKKVLEEDNLSKLDMEYARSLNYMAYLVDGKKLIDRICLLEFAPNYNKFDREELLIRLGNIEDKFNRPIPAETFLRLLNNVRRIEYYEDSEFYPYTLDGLYETYIRSFWKFSKHYYDGEEKLLMALLECNPDFTGIKRNDRRKDFINFIKSDSFYRNIKEVQLTKVLQKVYKKGIN